MSGTVSGGDQQKAGVDADRPDNLGPRMIDGETDETMSEPPSPMGYSEGEIERIGEAAATGEDVGTPGSYPTPDSGTFGVGSNEGEGDDNQVRNTEPGFQRDKGERGTIMPR